MLKYTSNQIYEFGQDRTGQIAYQFNRQGFRSKKDYDFVPRFAFFGCSVVFGIGVPVDQTFAAMYEDSHNYGLAGDYDNADIFLLLEKFSNSLADQDDVKIAVVWHARDSDLLDKYYERLQHLKILHFFCGPPLDRQFCYAMFPNVDHDVSLTHYGPKSHKIFWRLLSNLFDQL